MGRVQTVSTAGVPAAKRLFFWNTGSREIGSIHATPLRGRNFEAEVSTRHLGRIIVFGLKAAPHRVSSVGGSSKLGAHPYLRLRFQRSGSSTLEQNGVRHTIKEGEWLVFDGSRPHTLANEEDASQLSLQLPHSVLSERDLRLARMISGPLPMRGQVSRLLFECLRLSLEDLSYTNESTDAELGLSMLDMARASLNEIAAGRERVGSRETVEQRVRDHIRRNLCDPELSVDSIAQAMGCSPRYIHKVFEGRESIARLIWNQRLDRCRAEMVSAQGHSMTFTELAYEFGFSSSAHFSRIFRDRFGVTPSAFRAASLGNKRGS